MRANAVEILLATLLVLGAVTVLGHGLWVLFASLFRILTGEREAVPLGDRDMAPCLHCGFGRQRADKPCPECGHRYRPGAAAEWRDLQTTLKLLTRLQQQELLDAATLQRLTEAVTQRRQTLVHRPPAAKSLERLSQVVEQRRPQRAEAPLPPVVAAPPPRMVELVPEPAPVPQPVPLVAPGLTPSAEPARHLGWKEMVNSFFQERNILWGEIVGGLIVIGFSIALVISLWRTLEQIPYFPFFLFVAVTASFFGLGSYTLERWKLETTSRSLLVIALLMVPLDFLAMASLSRGDPTGLELRLVAEAAALLLFGWLGLRAARVMTPTSPRAVTLALLLMSASQLLVPWLLKADFPFPVHPLAVGALPVLAFVLVFGRSLGQLRRAAITEAQAKELLLQLGILGFAVLSALGLMLFHESQGSGVWAVARELALLLPLVTVPVAASGLMLHRELEEQASKYLGVIGTMLALSSVLLQFFAVGIAWLDPRQLLSVCAVNFLSLTFCAWRFRFPWLHASALVCVGLGLLTGWHLATGDLVGITYLTVFVKPINGTLLAGLAVGLAVLAEVWRARQRKADGAAYALGSLGIGLTGMVLLAQPGTELATRALMHGLLACTALASIFRWRLPALTHLTGLLFFTAALALLPVAPVGSLVWLQGHLPLLLGAATLASGGSLFLQRRFSGSGERYRVCTRPLRHLGVALSMAAVPLLLLGVGSETLTFLTWCGVWLTGLWLFYALWRKEKAWLIAAQLLLFVTVGYGVTAWLLPQEWVAGRWAGLLQHQSLQVYGIAWSLVCLGWVAVRLGPAWRPHLGPLGDSRRLLPEHFAVPLLIVSLLLFTLIALCPICAGEFVESGQATPPLPLVTEAFGTGAWLWAGILLVTLLLDLWNRWTTYHQHLLLLLLPAMPLLLAGQFAVERAALSAALWGLGLLYLATAIVMGGRRFWRRWARPLRCQVQLLRHWPNDVHAQLFLTTALPVLFVTWLLMHTLFLEGPRFGPATESFFYGIGPVATAVMPLVFVMLGVAGYAWQQRSHALAFFAGFLAQFAVLGGYGCHLVYTGRQLHSLEAYRVLQLFTLTAAGWALGWMALSWLRQRRYGRFEAFPALLLCQTHIARSGMILLLLWPAGVLFSRPMAPADLVLMAAGVATWLAVLLAFVVIGLPRALNGRWDGSRIAAGVCTALTMMLAFVVAAWEVPGHWRGYHTLMMGGTFSLWITWWVSIREESAGTLVRWPMLLWLLMAGLLLLGLRGIGADPQQPYWSLGVFVSLGLFAATLARHMQRLGLAYLAGVFSILAAVAVYAALDTTLLGPLGHLLVLGLSAFALVWALAARLPGSNVLPSRLHLPAQLAALVAFLLEAVLLLAALGLTLGGQEWLPGVSGYLGWLALGLLALAWAALWRWTAARNGLLALYGVGLLAVALGLHEAVLAPQPLLWTGGLALAAYSAATSALAWGWCRWQKVELSPWFVTLQICMGFVPCCLGFWITHAFELLTDRLGGAAIGLLLTCSVLMLIPPIFGEIARRRLQQLTLLLSLTTVQLLVWALLDPNVPTYWLHVNVAFTVLTAAAAWLFLLLPQRFGAWVTQAQRIGLTLSLVSLGAVVAVLVQEFLLFQPALNKVPLSPITVGAMLMTLGGLLALLLRCAVLPERDPWRLSETGRHGYVYLAEVVLVLLFCHLRLTLPEVFPPNSGRYWMFIVMGIAFLGVGLATFFQRLRLPVLSQPLARTGLFLPLLPLIAFWLKPSAEVREALQGTLSGVFPGGLPFLRYLENLPGGFDGYSLLLFFAGVVYGFVALTRRSFGFALIAVLAANFSLWALLRHQEIHFLLHPQAWLIPLALILLVSERLQRARLTEMQANTLRYVALIMLYIASTTDMFITGIGESVVLPLILAVLAVLGIMAGIFLRIKAYLFLGTAFLLVNIGSLIWHAAFDRQQMWVLWASGVGLGMVVLALFAYFEKHRQRVLFALEDMRSWE
jgi:hypothetical protein